jgi:hypothetical protein
MANRKPASRDERRVRGRTREEAAFPAVPPLAELPEDYLLTLAEIKQRIQKERIRVVVSANQGMVLLYWDLGRLILDRQMRQGWGPRSSTAWRRNFARRSRGCRASPPAICSLCVVLVRLTPTSK